MNTKIAVLSTVAAAANAAEVTDAQVKQLNIITVY